MLDQNESCSCMLSVATGNVPPNDLVVVLPYLTTVRMNAAQMMTRAMNSHLENRMGSFRGLRQSTAEKLVGTAKLPFFFSFHVLEPNGETAVTKPQQGCGCYVCVYFKRNNIVLDRPEWMDNTSPAAIESRTKHRVICGSEENFKRYIAAIESRENDRRECGGRLPDEIKTNTPDWGAAWLSSLSW